VSDRVLDRFYRAEYDRWLPALEKFYNAAPAAEKSRIEQLDSAFHEGRRDGFIVWARAHVPQAFSTPPPPAACPAPRAVVLPDPPGARAIDPLPDWWPDEPAYHGTRALDAIMCEGLCAPPAEYAAADPDYGWEAVWRDELYHSYLHHLEPGQRAAFNAIFGEGPAPFPEHSFGQLVSLFWVSRYRRVAAGCGPALEVDLSQLRYYWWFPDEVLGERSYVFVLPTNCPQAPPSAFRPVD
jgi:hypothetical protein